MADWKSLSLLCDIIFLNLALGSEITNCNATYGAMKSIPVERHLQAYVNTHITRSFEYLLMATHFNNYQMNRGGFRKLYQELSDEKWNLAFDLIKHITKRGGKMVFNEVNNEIADGTGAVELYELQSLAKALDVEKQLALDAHHIHHEVTRNKDNHHDPEIANYIEHLIVHKQAETIRKLSGYASDVGKMLGSNEPDLALYLFDEYLSGHSL